MLNRNMLGVFKVHDPDNVLGEDTYGFILYNTTDPKESICYTCTMNLSRQYDWETLPILNEAIYCDVYIDEDDRDEDGNEYEERLFDIQYKLFNQNTLKYLKLGYDEWLELEDLALRGGLKDIAKTIAILKQPLKNKWLLDNGYSDDGEEHDR